MVSPVSRSSRKIVTTLLPLTEPAPRSLASDTKAIYRPSPLIAGTALVPLAGRPRLFRLAKDKPRPEAADWAAFNERPVMALPAVELRSVDVNVSSAAPEVKRFIAFATFKRPPEITLPSHPGNGSTVSISSAFNWAAVRSGFFASNKAAAPVTCGAAMDVPEKSA